MNRLILRVVLPLVFQLLFVAALAARAGEVPAVEFLNSGKVTPTTLPFSEAVRVGNTLFLSGQIGVTPGMEELVPGGIEAEARQTLENIRTTLETHGYALPGAQRLRRDWPRARSARGGRVPGGAVLIIADSAAARR